MDRIFFLGTGGTAAMTAKQTRGTGGFLVVHEDLQFHVDPGPGALVAMHQYGLNPRATSVVLASHHHVNHCHDLNVLATALSLNKLDTHGVLVTAESVLANGMVSEYHRDCFERVLLAYPDKPIGIEEMEILPIPAQHGDMSCGFRITTPKFVLTYTGDTAFSKDLLPYYERSDILVMNVPDPFNKKGKQLSSSDAVKILQKVRPKLAVITHFGADMLKANPMYEVREIKKLSGVNCIAAEDGMSIDPVSYNATVTQKTLTMYKS